MSDQSGYPGAPPGWYPDPGGGAGQRWWDGYAWTEAVVVPQPPPPPWTTASERLHTYNASALVTGELGIAPLARFSLGLPAVTGLLALLVIRTQSSQMLQLGRDFKIAYDAAARGLPSPQFANESFSPWFLILGLVAAAGLVVTLIWQHRAAAAARALGFPTTYSPAWGVASWFVPVVNYWFPYQAIRDCLAPEDPHRGLVLQWWLAATVGGSLGLAAFIAGFFSSGVSVALSIPAAVAYVAVLAYAPRVVAAITVAHRTALEQQPGGPGGGVALGGR
ncbi:MAG TPA: DUF4328 domain-containing protein [Acidimicrobiales bacterium]|nr:DUF4328 domain-containing protein [Acidimicrobiales bacterium]